MIGRGEALEALRREVVGRQLEFATVIEVADGGPTGFLLHVRSGRRVHPHMLVVAADGSSLSLDHAIGEPLPVADTQLWAQGVRMWLIEQLDTGVLRWGQRVTLPQGGVAIDPMLAPAPASPWWVSPVPLDRPTGAGQRRLRRLARRRGRSHVTIIGGSIASEPDPALGGHLLDAGLDVRPGRAAKADGRLVQWLHLHLDDRGTPPPAGQLVASWRDESEDVVVLEHLEFEPSVPERAVEELVLAGVHAAADAGARVIEHRFDDVGQLQGDLPWQPEDGILRLRAADVP